MQSSSAASTNGSGPAGPAPARSMRWPIIVVALLCVHVLFMVGVAAIAVRDPSFAVLPDYYRKALAWDESRSAERESAKLGWTIRIEPAVTTDPLGQRSVRMTLRDATDQPIGGATLDVSYFHHSRANESQSATLTESAPGEFVAKLPMRRSGFYQFDIHAKTGERSFTTSLAQYVGAGEAK